MEFMPLSQEELRLFQNLIRSICGIEINDEKSYLIESRLSKILVDSKLSTFGELYESIKKSDNKKIIQKLIDAITTNETLWFRDKTPWLILEKLFLPRYISQLRSGEKKKIRIWSAAASTGQEAYSTAMCIHNYLAINFIKDITLDQFEIIATDISSLVLEIATRGRYDNISIMRGLSASLKQNYFQNSGSIWEIDREIKKSVDFMQFNLQDSFRPLGNFDVIFCRYVLIYFSEELKNSVISRMSDALHDDGVLFLGAYEMCDPMKVKFEFKLYEDSPYYVKLSGKEE